MLTLLVERHCGVSGESFRNPRNDVLPLVGRTDLDVLIRGTEGRPFPKAVGFDAYAVTLEMLRSGLGSGVATP